MCIYIALAKYKQHNTVCVRVEYTQTHTLLAERRNTAFLLLITLEKSIILVKTICIGIVDLCAMEIGLFVCVIIMVMCNTRIYSHISYAVDEFQGNGKEKKRKNIEPKHCK